MVLQHLAGHLCFLFVYGIYNNMLGLELIAKSFEDTYLSTTVSKELKIGQISSQHWISIYYKLGGAVKYVHSKSALHNDLKYDNVLIKEVINSTYIPKIIDFDKYSLISNPFMYALDEKKAKLL